jgi:hypothetical protein
MHDGDMDLFWGELEALRAGKADPDKPEPFRRKLAERLKALATVDVARFLGGFRVADAALDTQALWWVACLLRGEICEGTEFDEFRAWVVGHGRIAWAGVQSDADAIADWPLPTDKAGKPAPALAPLAVTPAKALDKRLDAEPDLQAACEAAAAPDGVPEDYGTDVGWRYWAVPTAAALASALPRLWKAHGHRWKDDADPEILRVHPREIDVPKLGRVKIGDTLVRRDGSTFEVLGLLDDRVFSGRDPDDPMFADDEEYAMARIREQDGTTSCGQYLGRGYQRWPHEPDSVFPEDEDGEYEDEDDDGAQAAWEARDEALQARVRAALADEGDVRIRFAAYDEDDDGLPVDNLDAVAHPGPILFVETDTSDGQRYESEVLTDPTWLDVARVANRAVLALGYKHHVYLEGIKVKRARGKPATGRLLLGS